MGGVDYSKNLSSVAKEIVGNQSIITGEAVKLDSKEKFDAVISDSVFAYFTDIEYASEVLEKMYDKSNKQIILLEIFDKSLEDECNDYRRSLVEDYDEKYRGLDKLFFEKQMFIDFAEAHNCDIEFRDVNNDYYWNSRYLFNCFLRKRDRIVN